MISQYLVLIVQSTKTPLLKCGSNAGMLSLPPLRSDQKSYFSSDHLHSVQGRGHICIPAQLNTSLTIFLYPSLQSKTNSDFNHLDHNPKHTRITLKHAHQFIPVRRLACLTNNLTATLSQCAPLPSIPAEVRVRTDVFFFFGWFFFFFFFFFWGGLKLT